MLSNYAWHGVENNILFVWKICWYCTFDVNFVININITKACVRRYFNNQGENIKDMAPSRSVMWCKKLVSFFNKLNSLERKVQMPNFFPYLYEIAKWRSFLCLFLLLLAWVCFQVLPHFYLHLEDKQSLKALLSDWGVFDILFNREYSDKLVRYWQKVGSYDKSTIFE